MNQSCVCLIDGTHINERLNKSTTRPHPPPPFFPSTFLFASQLKSQCMKERQRQPLWSWGQIFVRVGSCCVPRVCVLGWERINVYTHVLRRILHKVIRKPKYDQWIQATWRELPCQHRTPTHQLKYSLRSFVNKMKGLDIWHSLHRWTTSGSALDSYWTLHKYTKAKTK